MAHERALAWARARRLAGGRGARLRRRRRRALPARPHAQRARPFREVRRRGARARRGGARALERADARADARGLRRGARGLEDCAAIAGRGGALRRPALGTADARHRGDDLAVSRRLRARAARLRPRARAGTPARRAALRGGADGAAGPLRSASWAAPTDAQVLLQRASALALEVARTYCGPWCLGVQALHTPNVERARELLAQGEALLADGCVSHNHLEFRRVAMEFCAAARRFPRRRAGTRRRCADYTRGRAARLEQPHHRAARSTSPTAPRSGARRPRARARER